ncbi:hypothetical protein B0H14DRAFT_2591823 [Mycena olivaceomarginata]|nr:hypothetical protein B0H14DRAFT_2591823 [Mycena olivaceomarginata]
MSLFGELQPQLQQQTSNIFAGTTTQPRWQQQSGGGLFDAAQPSTTQPETTSIFGQPNMSQQAPSLFGSATNTNMNNIPNTGGGLFSSGTNTNTQGAAELAAGGSLFGNPQQQQGQQPASGGLFGTNTANANTGEGGLFGAVKPVGGLAGPPMVPSLNTQNQQQRPGLFGDAPSSSNIFGGSSTNTNGMPKSAPAFRSSFGLRLSRQQKQQHALRLPGAAQPGQGQGQRQAADVQMQFAQLTARIEGIAVAWNVAGPECQFQVRLYGRPPDTTNNVWVHAVRENLDPGWLRRPPAASQCTGTQAGAYQERMKIDHKFQCGCNYSGRTVSCWHHTKQWIRDSTSLLMPTYHKIFRLSSSMLKQLESGTTWIQLEAI